ncbi:MAG: baseplate assembly protein, partial [Microbacteriaceae bacterium]|nr:baseplate assembly protein [Microbacteriaceae bacterium]
ALAVPPAVSHVVMQTTSQNSISISDAPGPSGGLLFKSSTGAMIMINDTGITITNGQASIILAGTSVTINNGALVVN